MNFQPDINNPESCQDICGSGPRRYSTRFPQPPLRQHTTAADRLGMRLTTGFGHDGTFAGTPTPKVGKSGAGKTGQGFPFSTAKMEKENGTPKT